MSINISVQESTCSFLEEARKLTDRMATIDPALVMFDNSNWIDTENTSVRFCREQRSKMEIRIKKYQRSRERSALLSKKKYYELINFYARDMLCRLPVEEEGTGRSLPESVYQPIRNIALLLIWEMHNKWKDAEDLSLYVPYDLDADKKEFIDSYLHTIQSLDMNDESEGTFAFLLQDYCRTLILYNCALQFAHKADLESVRSVYGEYTDEAYALYEDTVYEMEAGDKVEDTDLI